MIQITALLPQDWPAVKAIYEEGMATGHATFETTSPDWDTWDQAHVKTCRLVAKENGEILGWAALSPVSGRCVYGGVAEVSVYVLGVARGKGIGRSLLAALITESELTGFWTLQAGIFPENTASLALHAGNGFRVIGVREKIGQKNGAWRDTVLLERRSLTTGR